jgi:predicted extracellular nuclease
VASFNVLNYFNGDGTGGGFPTSRGADSLAEFTRQQAKIVSALAGLNADIVGLIEIENDGYGPLSAIASLVNALNAVAGAGTYAYIDPGSADMGSDQIAVGFIYKPASVTPRGAAATLTSAFVDPDPDFPGGGDGFNSGQQRPSLAQTFEVNATGAVFTPVINHLKSKGSSAGGAGDADIGDGQGLSNGTRARAADTLVDWLKTDPTGSGDADFLILGDLNAYAMEDPVREIRSGADDTAGTDDDYASLVGSAGYSYGFNAQWGSLDHALASVGLQSQVTGAADWHINADEPEVLDYNVENKTVGQQTTLFAPDAYRSSDHDPVVVGLNLGLVKTGTPANDLVVGSSGNDTLGGGAGRDTISGGAGRDTIIGGSGRDVLNGGADADRFVYTSLVDAGDVIEDFQLGLDRLVIAQLLTSVGYTGSDPVGTQPPSRNSG